MQPLLTRSEMADADRFAIDTLGIPEMVLMEHAALAGLARLKEKFGSDLLKRRGLIVCGPGNNGGDGLALARLLYHQGITALDMVTLGSVEKLSESNKAQRHILSQMCRRFWNQFPNDISGYAFIVDALFGTGLSREVKGPYLSAIQRINHVADRVWVVALDTPSGLNADSGEVLGEAVKANETITYGYLKRGLVTGRGASHVGQLRLAPIEIPREEKIPRLNASAFALEKSDIQSFLPKRPKAGHKGNFGHVYLWAGVPETEGAIALSAIGALKSGAGRVTIVGDRDLTSLRGKIPPEVMIKSVDADFIEKEKGVFVFGPGFGLEKDRWKLLKRALSSSNPLVLDADALTLISQNKDESAGFLKKRDEIATVLTPHPGEGARLLDCSVEEIESDRYQACQDLALAFPGAILLKGAGSLIAVPRSDIWMVGEGNAILAKGGSGDVLSGMIGAILAQGSSPRKSAVLAAYLHNCAARSVGQSQGTERAAMASEVVAAIPQAWSEIENEG